ncbi:MAG TPA: DUF2069 domain-containing protein [Permianibacter sp.]|nr:DUF2069 domain-containing protein [Permianibacter sp.]
MTTPATPPPASPPASTPSVPPHATPHRWHRLTVLSWLTLIALLLVWHQKVPTPQPFWSLALALLPLLLPAPWLLRGKRAAVLALAVLSLLYFCHAVVALMAGPGERIWAGAELLVSLCLFISSTFTARLLR